MTMKKKCIYCGSTKNNTKHHVPPRGLFSIPRPANLKTVPCCKKCNEQYKKDEDLFVAWLNFGPAGISQGGKKMWNSKLHRTYKKDKGVKKIISKSFIPVDVITKSGIFVERRLGIKMEIGRIKNVLEEIARGLYWLEYKSSLPQNIAIIADDITKQEVLTSLEKNTNAGNFDWPEVFRYSFNRIKESPEKSLWILEFYQTNFFAVITGMDSKKTLSNE